MMKHAFGLFKRKEKKVKLVDADSELDHEFREGLQDAVEAKAHYEELLRVATRSAQQAQGFAQSQQDLAACFVETLGTVDDPDIADCFKRLGRVQGEIAKLLDNYSGHLNETIIKPTEELQHKLEQMEASRKVFEEKKQACEALKARTARSKRRSWGQNGEEPLDDQATLQAQDDFDDAFMSLGQQLMAVEQCRPKILFEQAARLHAAQMTLFTRALGNVHTIEPYIKDLSVQKNVDRRLPNGDGYSEHDDDDERSDADSVEHPPPSAWDDDFDSKGSSPTARLEIKDLPQEMPAEWSALLHGLDQTLQEMGEQTLDTKDAVFAVNALLMASTEQGKRQQMSDHMYHRSHSGPLSLNTHSGSRSAPLSSTGVPLHLLNAAQASGGQNPGPKTPPREEAEPPGKEMVHARARKPNLQVQVGGKVGTMSKSGPLTPTGVPAAMGSQSGTQTAATPSTTSRTPAPLTRSSGSRGSSFRAAKSGPVFPISAPAGGFGQARQGYGQGPRSLSHHFSTQQGSSSLVELGTTKSFAGPPTVQNNKPRNSSIYASKSGPIIMTQPRGIPLTPTSGGGASLPAHSIPYSLPTEASQGPPRISPDPIIPKSGPIGRSPLAKSSISPNTSPPLSPPRNSPPLQDELYQLPAPPIQVGSAPTGGGHFLAGGPLVRSAEPVLPNSSGISGRGLEGDGPSPLPPPPSGGKVLLRRNSRDRSEPSINGGNGLMINIPPQIHHTKSARTRPIPQTPLSPISPSEDGMSTPSPSRPPNSVGPLYLVHALNNGALEESPIRRSMSFEGVPQTSKPPPPAPTSGDPPRRSPAPPVSPERPLVTISSPLPAMPPSTPPERPESQGALNALAGQEREELIKAVNSENFRWKYVEEAPFKGPKQVPELETLEPDQRERLLQTLARAVKSRREAFIDEHTHGFSDLPSDLLVQETC